MIISHRGRYNGLKENTLEAFEVALKAGADAVECDLRLTQDKQVVVCHDNKLILNGRQVKISQTNLKHLTSLKSVLKRHSGLSRISTRWILESQASPDPQNDEQETLRELLTIDDLFDYIAQKRVPFFLEVKNRSPILVEKIVNLTEDRKLWSYVHVLGFSLFIKNALRAQAKYPKLLVLPIVNYPLYSYIKMPTKSYGVFIGWLDKWYGSEWLFKRSVSKKRLVWLKKFYEKKGFKVMAGVINKETGFKYFKQAGIVDIVTDNIKGAVRYFKKIRNSNIEIRNNIK